MSLNNVFVRRSLENANALSSECDSDAMATHQAAADLCLSNLFEAAVSENDVQMVWLGEQVLRELEYPVTLAIGIDDTFLSADESSTETVQE